MAPPRNRLRSTNVSPTQSHAHTWPASLPPTGGLPGSTPNWPAREPATAGGWRNQSVGQSIEPHGPLPVLPSDPPIPGCTPPGRGAEQPGRHRPVLPLCTADTSRPHRAAIAQIMPAASNVSNTGSAAGSAHFLAELRADPTGSASATGRESSGKAISGPPVLHSGWDRPPQQAGNLDQGLARSLPRKLRAAMSANCPLAAPVPIHTQLPREPVAAPSRAGATHRRICSSSRGCHARLGARSRPAHLPTRKAQIGSRVQRKNHLFRPLADTTRLLPG